MPPARSAARSVTAKLLINEGGELCGDINTLSSEIYRAPCAEQVMPLSAVAG